MSKRPVFKFGDLVINHTAGDRNPHKVSMAIKTKSKTVLCCNAKGETWEVYREADLENIGSVLNPEEVARMGAIEPLTTHDL